MDDRPTAKDVTDSPIDVRATSPVADDRGASPFDLWRPSVRRDDRRVRLYPRADGRSLAGLRRARNHFISVRTADPTSAHDAPTYANRTLHADVPFALQIRELMSIDPVGSRPLVRARIRRVVEYCAKLGRRRRDDDVDLFTVLPTASRQPRQA